MFIKLPNMKKFPPVSIIIVTLNSKRTIEECLNYIIDQTYPKLSEVLIVDGGSTDGTLEIVKKSRLPVKIINGKYRNNQEARRAIGVERAKNEICAMIDSDNYIIDKKWLERMVEPLIEHEGIIASQTLRYAAPKNASIFNRYFGLLGGADPAAYYLGKNDRLSWAFDKWNLLGKIISENKKYYIIEFEPNELPAVGCNGIVFKRSILLKSNWKTPSDYIHTDVFVDIAKFGYSRFAIVKNEIFHNTAENIWNFLGKRRSYMKFYHQRLNKKRRHLTFDPKRARDLIRLSLFVLFSTTIIEPFIEALRGYAKKRDTAWFLHPVLCLGLTIVYFESTVMNYFKK